MSPAVLFDPAKRVTTQDVAAMVDGARAQSANPRHTGQPGRRNFGAGEEVWLAWNDAVDAPVILPGGGIAVLAAADPDARVGVARDSASGAYLAWDMEAGAPWPDAQGAPIAIPADLVAAHQTAGGASPLTIATLLVVEHELRAFAEADEQTLPGRLASLNALLSEIEQSDHPLFDLLQPYVDAVQAMVPQVAGAARWSRISERRAAGQILDQFLRLIHIGLDDPARLHEIIDSNRAVALRDRTRMATREASSVQVEAGQKQPATDRGVAASQGRPIQLAHNGLITSDATVPWPVTDEAGDGVHSTVSPSAENEDPASLSSNAADGDEVRSNISSTADHDESVLVTPSIGARDVALGQFVIGSAQIDAWESEIRTGTESASTTSVGTRRVSNGLMTVLWDERQQSLVRSSGGGIYLLDAPEANGITGLGAIIETRTGQTMVWDGANGQPILGLEGRPLELPTRLLSLSDELQPRDLALLVAFNDVIQTFDLTAFGLQESESDRQNLAERFDLANERFGQLISSAEFGEGPLARLGFLPIAQMLFQEMRNASYDILLGKDAMQRHEDARANLVTLIADPFALAASAEKARLLDDEINADFLTTLLDMDEQVIAGTIDSLNDTITMADDVAKSLEELGVPNLYFQVLNENGEFDPDILTVSTANQRREDGTYESVLLPELPAAETRAGEVVRGFTEFAMTYVGAGRVLGAWGTTTRTGATLKASVQGSITDFTVFDPADERFSNWIQSVPELQNPVAAYLAADGDDSELEGRIKNVLEGIGAGLIADSLIGILRLTRSRAATRIAWRIPGRAQAFIRTATEARAITSNWEDQFSREFLESLSEDESKILRMIISFAIGESGERYAVERISAGMRIEGTQIRRNIESGPRQGRYTRVDISAGPGFVDRVLGRFGFDIGQVIDLEVKTGHAQLTINQVAYLEQLRLEGNEDAFRVLRVPFRDIPPDIFRATLEEYLSRYSGVTEEMAEQLMRSMKAEYPDLPLIYLLDFIARETMSTSSEILNDDITEIDAGP